MVEQHGTVEIPCLSDIVVASSGGYPKDINFYQAHKALENAKYFVREGGVIILVAECPEGFGNKIMQQWMLEIRIFLSKFCHYIQYFVHSSFSSLAG